MIAKNIRILRQRKGITQKALAEAIHVTSSAISQYETGKSQPSRENMALIANYFNVSIEYIEGTSRIEKMEEQMNETYVNGLTVSGLLDKCLCVSPMDRVHLIRVVDLMAKDNPGRR